MFDFAWISEKIYSTKTCLDLATSNHDNPWHDTSKIETFCNDLVLKKKERNFAFPLSPNRHSFRFLAAHFVKCSILFAHSLNAFL